MSEKSGGAPLPEAIRLVLFLTATVVTEHRPALGTPEAILASRAGVEQLLGILPAAPVLRSTVRARLLGERPRASGTQARVAYPDGPDSLGWLLLAADPTTAAEAAEVVWWLVGDADRRQRRQIRTDRLLAETRRERDRARARADTLQRELTEARLLNTDLAEAVSRMQLQLAAARDQLDRVRTLVREPRELAGILGGLLAGGISDPPAGQGGEPAQPGSGRLAVALLTEAARDAGLPQAVAADTADWLPPLLGALARRTTRTRVGAERSLRVEVLGGGDEIGGSCLLITAGSTRILIDAGVHPARSAQGVSGPRHIETALRHPIDAVIVTHAHNDHAGWVPAVVRRQPRTPVFATPATVDLLGVLWTDSARISSRAGSWSADGTPPYGETEVSVAISALEALSFGVRHTVRDMAFELFPAGHILGAAGVVVHVGELRIVVSGDVSRSAQQSVGGAEVPMSARGADLLILESTYAGRTRRPPRTAMVESFVRAIADVTSAGGRVLVPASAFGRAQEVALLCAQHLPHLDVAVDGLARDVSEVYARHAGISGAPLDIYTGNVVPVPRGGTTAALRDFSSGVIIATSGMLAGGPAVRWARALLPDPTAALLLVGFQSKDSPGQQLIEAAENADSAVLLPSYDVPEPVSLRARVARYPLGAHATEDELVEIAREVEAHEVMLVHGTPGGQAALNSRFKLRGQPTVSCRSPWTPRHA